MRWLDGITVLTDMNLSKLWKLVIEKVMAPHSSTLAWKIRWMEEPGRLQSMGLWRVRHDWGTSLSLFTLMHWRRIWQSTPVLLPGKSDGWRSIVGYSPWGLKESDMTERLHFLSFFQICRRHHPNGRKWRELNTLLMRVKGGEWKSWLKTQHSKN